MLHRRRFHVTNVASVVPVDLLLLLASSHELVLCVHNHTVVAVFARVLCDIVWLMLAAQEVSAHASDTTKRHPLSVEQVPSLALVLDSDVLALRRLPWLSIINRAINESVIDFIHPVPDVGVELDARVLFLRLPPFSHALHFTLFLLNGINGIVTLVSREGGELQPLLRLSILLITRLKHRVPDAERSQHHGLYHEISNSH